MKKTGIILSVILGMVACFSLVSWAEDYGMKEDDVVTVCKPGDGCGKFETVAKDPKNCKCGAVAEKFHVLKIEGDIAVLCTCSGDCKCDLNPKNPYLCGCGSPVKVVRIVK